MSLNKILIFLVIAGYLFVNITMQIDFFAGRDIFAKYQLASSLAEQIAIAQKAYYAKTAFLLLLLVLLALSTPFGLAFGLSFLVYAIAMLVFFGIGRPTLLYSVASVALLVSYFVPVPLKRKPSTGATSR